MKGEEAVAFAVGFFRGEGGGEKRAAVHEGLGAVEASGQPGERGRGVEAGAAVGVVEAEAGGALDVEAVVGGAVKGGPRADSRRARAMTL